MEREPSGFPFLEINNILTQLKCLQLVKKWFYHFFDKLRAEPCSALSDVLILCGFAYLKYRFSIPSKALPWRASSRAISWTVS